MTVDWVMETPTTEDETRGALVEYLIVERCDALGVDIAGIEISECD